MKLVNKALKGALKYGLTWFVAVYIGIGGYAVCDYKFSHSKKIEEKTKNNLVIQKYNVPLEDRIKELTIVGEIHLYNSKETEFAKDYINKFEHVAKEGSSKESSDLFVTLTALGLIPTFLFYSMGSGRSIFNHTLSSLSEQKGKTVYFLEDKDKFDSGGTLNQKFALLGCSVLSLAAGPMGYFEGKREFLKGSTGGNKKLTAYVTNLNERDDVMVENLLKILEKDEVDSLLCVVGKAHVQSIVEKLKGKIKIKRIYN